MKTGYSIKTWRMRLFCPHNDWLVKTEAYYREVLNFYYGLLLQREELWNNSLFQIQRELEILTVAGRDGRQPECPLPFSKVPVYFRRSAINKAAAAVKSAASKDCGTIVNNPEILNKGVQENIEEERAQFPSDIQATVTFFKGMYRNLSDQGIQLKLWNGEKWCWAECTLSGRDFPEDGTLMSPVLVKEKNWYMLHIPVKQENKDARNAKERMAAGERICSVRFTNTDTFAMCCVLVGDGSLEAVQNCRGGDAYRHHCRQLLDKINKSRVYTDKDNSSRPNKKYYTHLRNLSEHYAHQVSSEIVDFCKKQNAGIVVLPIYNEDFSKMSLYKSGNFSPLHLSSRIRSFLKYKAWAEGILVLEVRAEGVGKTCAVCGGKVKQKGKMFQCENGHEGNRYLNDARNLGVKCQESFKKNSIQNFE
ncbi:MAG: zinc ribbon domain-containing protein [Eubacteriales bacterium]|nr:zinc ribbon domain-containing protein [Eubacteriales bacterium]